MAHRFWNRNDDVSADDTSLAERTQALTMPTTAVALPLSDRYEDVDEAYSAYRSTRAERPMTAPSAHPRCFLCSFGNRPVDAGAAGSKLLSELQCIIERLIGTKKAEELVAMTVRWVEDHIRPALRKAGLEHRLPAKLDEAELLEHFNTGQHTKNSHMYTVNMLESLERIRLRMGQFIFPRGGPPDLKVAAMYLKYTQAEKKLHESVPGRMAFGGRSTDDVNPDLRQQAPFASSTVIRRLRHERGGFVADFLTKMHEPLEDGDVS